MNQPAILGAVIGLGAASFGYAKVKQYKWKAVFFGLFGMTSGLVYKYAEKKHINKNDIYKWLNNLKFNSKYFNKLFFNFLLIKIYNC